MAGVSDRPSRGPRRAPEPSTDPVDQNQAIETGTAPGGDSAAPAAPAGDGPSSSTPAASDGQSQANADEAVIGDSVTLSTGHGVDSALAERVEALTAEKAALQARIELLEAAQPPADARPTLDALLADALGKKVWAIEVVGPAAGRWRAGRRFGPEAQRFVEGQLTDDELKAIQADPLLAVGVSEVPVHAAEAM